MKRASSALFFALVTFTTFCSAAQIQGFASIYAPGDVKEKTAADGENSRSDLHSDLAWSLGAEFLVFPVGPLLTGGGLGFISVQKDGDDNVVMPAVPLWGSVGVIAPETWKVRPYLEARVGYPIPVSRFLTWWNKPLNFFVGGNVGAQLPYHMGVEFNCVYLTMNKHFNKTNSDYRLSSLKLGGSITVHFDLFKSSAKQDKAAVNVEEKVSSDVAKENAESPIYDDQPYSDFENQTVEQPVEEPAAVEPVEEPVAEAEPGAIPPENPLAEEVTESVPEAVSETDVSSVEETPAVEDPVPEPALEPAEEPAPEPEKKPAAKKKTASKKKTTKKAPAKKTAKKKTTSKKRR